MTRSTFQVQSEGLTRIWLTQQTFERLDAALDYAARLNEEHGERCRIVRIDRTEVFITTTDELDAGGAK